MSEMTRREFLETSGRTAVGMGLGAAVAGTLVTPTYGQARRVGANDKILLGPIGCAGQGRNVMSEHMRHPDVEFVAVCDVDSGHMAQAAAQVQKQYGKAPAQHKDFRALLDRKEIDAVVIGTPDHWHALPMIYACETGKDVYVEKPISHDIIEGRAMVNAAKKFGRVVQVGTWQR